MNQKALPNGFKMRELDLKADYEELLPFYDMIFERELSEKGVTIKSTLDEMMSFLPLLKVLGFFSKNYKHAFDGFVIENDKSEIVSTVNIGFSGNFWEISMVATHPDYRRKGLAKRLIQTSLEHAKTHKAKMCVLEVLEQNTGAYNLYTNQGFHHYDTIVKIRLDKEKLGKAKIVDLPEGYRIAERKLNRKTNQKLYDFALNYTPNEVQEFLPINRTQYFKPFMIRLLRPLMKLFIGSKSKRFVIYHNDDIVGNLFLGSGSSEDDCHKMNLEIDRNHVSLITQPLLNFAENFFEEHSKYQLNIISDIRKSETAFNKELVSYGFTIFETDHLLGLKMNE